MAGDFASVMNRLALGFHITSMTRASGMAKLQTLNLSSMGSLGKGRKSVKGGLAVESSIGDK